MFDTEPIERTAHLGQSILVDRLAGLVGVKVVATTVGIERAGQAVRHKGFQQAAEGRGRAFLLHQEGRIDRAGGIVHRHDQIGGCPASQRWREPSWCSIMPSHGFLSRLRRCAPRRFARSTSPAACSCVLVQV